MVMVVDDLSTNNTNESKDDECSHGLLGGLVDGWMDRWGRIDLMMRCGLGGVGRGGGRVL